MSALEEELKERFRKQIELHEPKILEIETQIIKLSAVGGDTRELQAKLGKHRETVAKIKEVYNL